jgi:preprotein translocase subunit SecY
MLNAIANVFKIAELRNKVLFTLGMLIVFRLGYWIPIPGVDAETLRQTMERATADTESVFGRLAQTVSMFSGGSLGHSTIFGLGVMPYITASIVFQLLMAVWPKLKKIQEDGPTGRQKIMEWTRYLTLALCVVQGIGWLQFINNDNLIYKQWATQPAWWAMAILCLTAGTFFLMWIGEQIDKHGIGNGISMIIAAGILAQMPSAITWVINNYAPGQQGKIGPAAVALLLVGFVVVVAGSVLLTVAQRRIPVQLAKHSRGAPGVAPPAASNAPGTGRSAMEGQRSFLPLRVNHSGVMPVVFASSLMIFPAILFGMIANAAGAQGGANVLPSWLAFLGPAAQWLADNFAMGQFPYIIGEVALIYFFSYFWITVQFNPEEMSKHLRDTGSFIPGIRPGPRTAEYLEAVMGRITYVGAAFLAGIAILPMVISNQFGVPFNVAQFLGGTGLLIVVSVVLDFMQRVEANLLMRNYQGFLGAEGDKGPRIRGRMAVQ